MGLAEACGWIDAQLAWFSLVPAAPPGWMAQIKALGDLCHGGDALERAEAPAQRAAGTAWLDFAYVQLGRGERVRELIRSSPMYAPAAITFLPLALAGRPSPALIDTLAHQVVRAELPPLAWTMLVPTLELYGIEPTGEMRAAAARMSLLANEVAAAVMPFDAAYVLAHEIMYATRFGRSAPAWPERTDRYVRAVLPGLAARAVAADDADLWAELAVAHAAVTGEALAGEALLARAQTAAGNVTPPTDPDTMFARLPHPRLARTYHTTLVAIMAWVARASTSPRS